MGGLNNPRVYYAIRIRSKYGLEIEDWDRMIIAQSGRCAVCVQPLDAGKSTHIDHCHKTGVVRGVLCTQCNTAIGLVGEQPERLRAIADYLSRFAIDHP